MYKLTGEDVFVLVGLWASPSNSSFRALGSSRSSIVYLSSLSSTKDLNARFTAGSLSLGRLRFSWTHISHILLFSGTQKAAVNSTLTARLLIPTHTKRFLNLFLWLCVLPPFYLKAPIGLCVIDPTWNSATNCWTLLWAITTGSARPNSRRRPGSGTRTSALVSRMSLSRKRPQAPAKIQCMSTGYRSSFWSSGSHRPLTYSCATRRTR